MKPPMKYFILFAASAALSLSAAAQTFDNPVLPGFYPDPSVCRVGEDYYMVTSSFEWFPGLPVFHSKDLVNWRQIGHVLDRPSQLAMKDGMRNSHGLWAPTIRHHNGRFYVICTATGCGGNFFVTSDNAAGPYSEPVFIEDSPGIDPSLFFDDDGTVWYSGSWNGEKKDNPRRWFAEDRIYIQQLDIATGKFIGERHIVTSGFTVNSPYTEAPHIYKMFGKYYLVVAEGGTWEKHAVTVFTAGHVIGPYTPFIGNPVLTHRHLGNDIDITTIGHADIVETQFGDWYAVMLGVRPNGGYNMLGRETFLTSVVFDTIPPTYLPFIGPQPIFNPGVGRVLMKDRRPNLPWTPVAEVPAKDDFDSADLGFQWNFLRTPFEKWYSINPANSKLVMKLRPNSVTEWTNPSLIARRVQHFNFDVECGFEFSPKTSNEEVGLVIMQNDRFHYRLTVTCEGSGSVVKLIKVMNGEAETIALLPVKSPKMVVAMKGRGLEYSFYAGENPDSLRPVGGIQDATVCSSNVAAGFIGPYLGMYASSNGKPSKRSAEFDWFIYKGL